METAGADLNCKRAEHHVVRNACRMLTNADFRRLLSTGAQHSGATDERATAKPPAAPEPRTRHSGGRRPEVPFDILRLAAEAVACACVERVPLRTSTGLSRVPAESRNAVFACAAETLEVHRIPGAEAMELYFDRRTSTEEAHDVVRVYAGEDFMQLALEHSGLTTAQWPGTSGVPPVIIPGDSFGVTFSSDASDTSWGWQITARARVPEARVADLKKVLREPFRAIGRADLPTEHVLEVALANNMLSVEKACELLTDPAAAGDAETTT